MGLRPPPFDKSRADDEEYVAEYRAELERRLRLSQPDAIAGELAAALSGVTFFVLLLILLT